MKDINDAAFISLFKEACLKCFVHPLVSPLSETDSKVFSNAILERTGLVIGVKSIKNYSQYVLKAGESKKENPSVSTLDTLARYVLDAPHTDEGARKDREDHYPYWFQYRANFSAPTAIENRKGINRKTVLIISLSLAVAVLTLWILVTWESNAPHESLAEEFTTVNNDSLRKHGWQVKNSDSAWWTKRGEERGYLSLFTLLGDNWPGDDGANPMRNVLVRELDADCFSTEIHLRDFYPDKNWQQAGILLGEDENFSGKVLRLSISYNDFFGGYKKDPEIIIQGLSSTEASQLSKPEEFAHVTIVTIPPEYDSLARNNLAHSALKIEKKGKYFRFLYTTGSTEGFAFKEAARGDFEFNPRYLGLFAVQGLAREEHAMRVRIDKFSIAVLPCDP